MGVQMNPDVARHPSHPRSVTTALCFDFTRLYDPIVSETDSRVTNKAHCFRSLSHVQGVKLNYPIFAREEKSAIL